MGSFMPESSRFKGVLEVPDPWFDDDAERRGFYRVWLQPGKHRRQARRSIRTPGEAHSLRHGRAQVLDLLDDGCEGLLDSILAAPAS